MREDGRIERGTNYIQRLTLRFIDGHRECQVDWKLQAAKFEGEIVSLMVDGQAGKKDGVSGGIASDDLQFQDSMMDCLHQKWSSITETTGREDVAHEYHRSATLNSSL
jgi:hypothetical protein